MLTGRQIQLLSAIINEHISTSQPVASEIICTKYKMNCSPATVRNEMARLLDLGFLDMLHTSSGRVPTSTAYRFFLSDIMKEDELPVLQEIAMKQRLWPTRFVLEKLLREAVVSLSDITKELVVATIDDGYVTHAGAVNVLDNREFWDIEVAKAALFLVDKYELLNNIFTKAEYGHDVRYVIGEDFGRDGLDKCSMVFMPYSVGNKHGYMGVLGPARMKYPLIMPAIKFTKGLVEELGGSW